MMPDLSLSEKGEGRVRGGLCMQKQEQRMALFRENCEMLRKC